LIETQVEDIVEKAKEVNPQIIIIDSIQTMTTLAIDSTAGSVSQIRECTSVLSTFAKQNSIPIIIVGHITKDGSIAGPKVLEHIVDVVLQFEGDRNYGYRILRSVKNRFGSTNELGIFEMQSYGLREVSNPSEILLSNSDQYLSGTAIAATMEGSRPMFIETQALVANSYYASAQKSSTGLDLRRLSMLLAVLEKKVGVKISNKDVFLNIAGGLKVSDPAIDLAVIASLISSNADISISSKHCFAAEVGLSGELRPVVKIEQRIAEANKLGFERIYISKYNLKSLDLKKLSTEVVALGKIEEIIKGEKNIF
jgi:DNA repair protein RadA/Sms